MKIGTLALLLVCGLLCGCANQYVITLHNGRQVTAASKPRLKGGSYVFKDALGAPAYVSAGTVREIAPASMSKEKKGGFRTGPGQQ